MQVEGGDGEFTAAVGAASASATGAVDYLAESVEMALRNLDSQQSPADYTVDY